MVYLSGWRWSWSDQFQESLVFQGRSLQKRTVRVHITYLTYRECLTFDKWLVVESCLISKSNSKLLPIVTDSNCMDTPIHFRKVNFILVFGRVLRTQLTPSVISKLDIENAPYHLRSLSCRQPLFPNQRRGSSEWTDPIKVPVSSLLDQKDGYVAKLSPHLRSAGEPTLNI